MTPDTERGPALRMDATTTVHDARSGAMREGAADPVLALAASLQAKLRRLGLHLGDGNALEVAAALIAELPKATPLWQPIETAPRDGTLIDLWVVSESDDPQYRSAARMCDCKWGAETHEGGLGWVSCIQDGDFSGELRWVEETWDWVVVRATHWMPPPEPPK